MQPEKVALNALKKAIDESDEPVSIMKYRPDGIDDDVWYTWAWHQISLMPMYIVDDVMADYQGAINEYVKDSLVSRR